MTRFRIDRTYARLIALLQKNARLSNKELAAHVELAPSSCLERVRRLREAGVFRGYHAEVEPSILGISLQAMVAVRLRDHARQALDAFRTHAGSLPEVHAVFQMAGNVDFLLHVMVRDANHLLDLNSNHLSTRPEVDRIETSIIFDHHRNPVLPNYTGPDA
ncbi:MAG: Lrp/AsnC family transcriptional regulator [Bacteroidota bacterium]